MLSTPGYQAPVKKSSRCRNERQEGLAGGKAGSKAEVEKKMFALQMAKMKFPLQLMWDSNPHQESCTEPGRFERRSSC